MTYDGASVLAALQTWWRGGGPTSPLPFPLYHKSAPENGNVLPYATFFMVSNVNEAPTTGSPGFDMYRTVVQFNFHDSTDVAAESWSKTFRQYARLAPLSINGSPVMHVLTDSIGLDEGEGLAPYGKDCWVAMATLDILWTE